MIEDFFGLSWKMRDIRFSRRWRFKSRSSG